MIIHTLCITLTNTFYTAWDNLSVHALNTALAGFEIFFTNIPPPSWWYVIPTAALLASYLGVAYITEATQGFYRTFSFFHTESMH
jgi:hypothetical protein